MLLLLPVNSAQWESALVVRGQIFLAFQQLFYYLENHLNAYISAKSQQICIL